MCTECGNVIPRLTDSTSQPAEPTSPSPYDFGVTEQPAESQFGIDVGYPPPPPPPEDSQSSAYPAGYPPYDHRNPQPIGRKTVCERCGTVLRADDKQCSGCGMTNPAAIESPSPYGVQQQPYQPSEPYTPPAPYAPRAPPQTSPPQPPPPMEKPRGKPQQNIAKCSSCGAIVYDYETRCSNCDRILSPPTKPSRDQPQPEGQAPPGTARCSRCNAIVYPHQTKCPNCDKPLAPIPSDTGPKRPSQRISRCKRCSHIVYPTDTRCQNCGRKLDAV
jgi:RNA polymerase subunit RPABC4/transcription elongation factor Spt4